MDIRRLIKRCLQQDRKAQKLLFDQYKGKLMGICLRYAKHQADAEDIFQEAFSKIFSQLVQLKDPQAFEAWAKSIVVRTALSAYQKQVKRQPLPLSAVPPSAEPLDRHDRIMISQVDHSRLLASLQTLPASQRMVFNLYVIEGYSHREIGSLLAITEASSRVYLTKARKQLQRQVEWLYKRSNK